MSDEYPMVEAFSHLSTDALDNIIQLCDNYYLPSAIIRTLFRNTAEAALSMRHENEGDEQ